MCLKTKIPLLTRSLIAAITLVGAAHAASPLEQILNQQVDKFQQHSNDRGSSNESSTERNNERDHRNHREHRYGSHHDDNHSSNTSCRDERNLRSVQGNTHTTMKFVNRTNQEVRSYWLDYNGRRVFYKAIPPNGNYTQPTFQTHPWVITDARDNCLDIYVSNQPSAVVEIR